MVDQMKLATVTCLSSASKVSSTRGISTLLEPFQTAVDMDGVGLCRHSTPGADVGHGGPTPDGMWRRNSKATVVAITGND